MAAQHTQGHLTYREDGEWLVSLLQNGQQLPHSEDEKLRRLAACWNYCEGLDTDGMELAVSMGRPIKTFVDESIKKELELTVQRDQLLEALDHIAKTIDRQLELIADRAKGDFLDKRPVVQSLKSHARRAHAAIANTTGGSTAPQSADYKAGFRAGMEHQERVEVDLLEALHKITAIAEQVDGWESFPLGPIEAARAAIAKATGGAA